MNPDVKKRVAEWLDGPYDEETKEEIKKLKRENPAALEDAFYTDLAFGTGGLRGIMGVGTNRMNNYTVRAATQGLANYINSQVKKGSVFISYDCRNHSKEYAYESAKVLAGNGIKAYVTKELRPTPYVSFGVREKKCTAGIMITASHNLPAYNGYKVYWEDGAQVIPPHDKGIIDEVRKIKDPSQVKVAKKSDPLIEEVDELFDLTFMKAIAPLSLRPQENKEYGKHLHVTYTSLHGTGVTLIPRALDAWGFGNVNLVDKQVIPDGNFSTVSYPNPEDPEALKMGIETMLERESDILLATDPDADRMGMVVNQNGKPHILTGNEIATLFVHYLFSTLQEKKKLPKNGAIVTTIVSTEMLGTIAKKYSLPCFEVLTGFKYIGEKIKEWEDGSHRFLFGAEESYGYLFGTHSRDKDAVIACCMISEIALYMKRKEKTLIDLLNEIYTTYGMYREKQKVIKLPATQEGMEKMGAMMAELRAHLPTHFLGSPVISVEDYSTLVKTDLKSKKEEKLTLPKSNVLLFRTEDGSRLVFRPSGTEPKLKIYGSVHKKEVTHPEKEIEKASEKLDLLLEEAAAILTGNREEKKSA